MTQESPGERLLRMGGIGSQSQNPSTGAGGGSRGRQGNPNRGPGNRGGGSQRRGLPEGYLRNGYFDENGNIHESLIVEDAQNIARSLEEGGMSRNQLRNFYNEVANVRRLVTAQPQAFDSLKQRVLKLRAFASNATSQRADKAPQLFYDFIARNVELASTDRKSFLEGFYEHFECVVLYFNGR